MSGKRGFAAMDPYDRRALAALGGRIAHETGKAHEWTSEEAKEAARMSALARFTNKHRREHEREV